MALTSLEALGEEVGSLEFEKGICWLLNFSQDKLICYEMGKKIMLREKD